MKLRDFGLDASREWFQQILEWSRKRITLEDNVDCQIITANINTSETVIGHSLGRTPRLVIPVASYPYGTAHISFTKEPTAEKLFLTRSTAGLQALILL